jgi:diguanylate cyclase (GGDEF)-like protein
VRLEQLGFLNAILDVPQSFNPVAVLAVGEPEALVETAEPGPALADLLLAYEPKHAHLEHWSDPVRLGELARSRDVQRAFLSDKNLLLRVIQTAAEVNACTDLDAAFTLVTRELRRILRYDRASVAYVDPDDGKARLRNIHKESGLPIGDNHEIPLEEGNVIGWVILNKAGVCRNEIATEDMFSEQMSAEQLRSDMVVPLVAEGRVHGTLNVGCYQPNAFTQCDFEILREFGKLLGTAVERLQRSHKNAFVDLLTGLSSRQRFHELLAKEIARCRQDDAQYALLLVNLDRFSLLNETYGHDVGDKVLVSVAQAIRASVRDVDQLARFGGEEFIVLLPQAGAGVLALVAERVRGNVESRVHALHHTKLAVQTTVSIGGAVWSREDAGADCVAQAQAALRRAKRDGRNCFRLFDAALDSAAASRTSP